MDTDSLDRPIGFWLKRLDELIEDTFEQALDDAGLCRRQWQALNVLRTGAVTRIDLAVALRPFLGEDAESGDLLVDNLVLRGWVTRHRDGSLTLTPAGHAARDAAAGRVAGIRGRILDGLSECDYLETVRVLRAMGDNLERALPSHC